VLHKPRPPAETSAESSTTKAAAESAATKAAAKPATAKATAKAATAAAMEPAAATAKTTAAAAVSAALRKGIAWDCCDGQRRRKRQCGYCLTNHGHFLCYLPYREDCALPAERHVNIANIFKLSEQSAHSLRHVGSVHLGRSQQTGNR
jgi:Tfp pilus assembly major pilin PilA